MNFERHINPKDSIGIGIMKNLPKWMNRSGYDYKNYIEVWRWSIEKNKNFMFKFIVDRDSEKGFDCLVKIGDYNNELLWRSIELGNIVAVKALLTLPKLFSKEAFTHEVGTTETEEHLFQGAVKIKIRETNLGAFINLARTSCPEAVILLIEYTNE